VLQLPSPRTIKEVQSLNGKLASLNRFLSKSAKKYLPPFQTLKKYIKKNDFHWTAEAEQAFQQLKQHLSELPLLVAPKPQEELVIYLSAAYGAISVVLMTERGMARMPIYFISRALQGPELNYSPMEKLVLSLVFAAKRLRRYFQAHPITVITDQPIKQVMLRPDVAGQLQKWSIMLGEYNVTYRPRTSIKGKILADFLIEIPGEVSQAVSAAETQEEPWTLFTDDSSCVDGGDRGRWTNLDDTVSGLLKRMNSPRRQESGKEAPPQGPSIRVNRGVLYRRSFLTSWLRCVGPLQAEYVMWEIHEGSCSMHAGPRSVVAKAIRLGYYWPTMHKDARDMIQKCNDCQWIEAKVVATITGRQVKKFVWDNIVCHFGILVIPTKIGMSTYRTTTVDVVNNDEELRLKLDLLEERRERAAICEAKAKSKMMKYYNARVRGVAFKPCDFVYRNNDAVTQ
nr:reverse transcriptase domain-containing protein [Tanacetum cinerariifolium]